MTRGTANGTNPHQPTIFGRKNINYTGPQKACSDVMDHSSSMSPRRDFPNGVDINSEQSIRDHLELVSDPSDPRHDDMRTRLYELTSSDETGQMSGDQMTALVAEPDGGATVDMRTRSTVTSGFAYSPYPERSFAVPVEDLRPEHLSDYLAANADIFDEDPSTFLGLWHDPQTGTVYVDVSIIGEDAAQARQGCVENDQIAFFDLQTFQSVDVDRTNKSGQKP